MKLKHRFSPSIKTNRTTTQIMNELTLALCVVLAFALIYYGTTFGTNYVLHIVGMLCVSMVTALICEWIFAYLVKKDFKKHIATSYPHVTVLILVLICQVNVGYFGLAVATIFAIGFGKLVYGGFGQNIFNPAGVGRVILMSAFATNVVNDLSTSATPVSMLKTQNWTIANGGVEAFFESFGGFTHYLFGWHPGSIGETSAVLLIVLGIFLLIRKVIDYRITFSYLLTILVLSLVVAGVSKMDLFWYPFIQLTSGGVLFAAVFMLTDPVTSPLNAYGRAVFGVGAGFLTVFIRLLGATPGSVVYSILLMNMFVPLIDYVLAGNQIKTLKKARTLLIGLSLFSCVVMGVVANGISVVSLEDDKATLVSEEEISEGVLYTIESKGFEGMNEFKIVVGKDGAIVSVENSKFSDTEDVGDQATTKKYLGSFVGLKEAHNDIVSSATYTSNSVIEAVKLALKLHGGK